jgi:hypothetical protein
MWHQRNSGATGAELVARRHEEHPLRFVNALADLGENETMGLKIPVSGGSTPSLSTISFSHHTPESPCQTQRFAFPESSEP